MKLYAISDLHLNYRGNREALYSLPHKPDDWLILAGDVCDTGTQLAETLDYLCSRFAQVLWVPGNHELWVEGKDKGSSVDKYHELVDICRDFSVATPEDEYLVWENHDKAYRSALLHLLYDYSFRPDNVEESEAIDWAVESHVLSRDEYRINPYPYSSKIEWCHARLEYSRQRLEAWAGELPLVLVNHFPLRYDLSRTMRIPRFSIWCGTRATEQWHRRYGAEVVVSGHLHMRATDYRDGVRFEEVSLGYPRDWKSERGMDHYLREILPGSQKPYHQAGPFWRF